jgi:short-subunit dehydrogenase
MSETVLILGAGGGLGSAMAREYARRGARVLLAGRNPAALADLAQRTGGPIFAADLADGHSLRALREQIAAAGWQPDVIVDAAGVDVRKALVAHDERDIARQIEVNLRGAILLTHTFLPDMLSRKQGCMVFLGGFGDGRLAFPYYSVDAATRAGLRAFLEAVNREIEGSGVILTYFCPTAADTDAERPYHAMWREMGLRIAPPESVAREAAQAVERRKRVHIMGWTTRLFAALNAVFPRLADALIQRQYKPILARYFSP